MQNTVRLAALAAACLIATITPAQTIEPRTSIAPRPQQEARRERDPREITERPASNTLLNLLQRLDENNDHKISLKEFQVIPMLSADRFNLLDRDGDGFIESDELKLTEIPGRENVDVPALLRRADKNGDKKVTQEEFKNVLPRVPERIFTFLDRNGDGVLSRGDAQLLAGPAVKPEGPQREEPPQLRILAVNDANHDGKVTYQELARQKPGFPKEAFTKMDTNKDGVLTQADLPKPPHQTRTNNERRRRALGREGNAPRAVGIEKGAPGKVRGIQGGAPGPQPKENKTKTKAPRKTENKGGSSQESVHHFGLGKVAERMV